MTSREGNTLGRSAWAWISFRGVCVRDRYLCAYRTPGWLARGGLATVLFVCSASSAFLGVLGLLTGIGGVFSRRGARLVASVGIGTSPLGICLFLTFLAQFGS